MLCEEIEAFKPVLSTYISKPVKLLEFVVHNNRCTSFPNLFIALRICMTVTVAPEKGSFLKLKLIKTSFVIFNQQERLNSLAFYPLNTKLAKV